MCPVVTQRQGVSPSEMLHRTHFTTRNIKTVHSWEEDPSSTLDGRRHVLTGSHTLTSPRKSDPCALASARGRAGCFTR